ncbi:hypothetical protein [Microscilla marina]|uniref:Lipoprotein n=1 Tax=Microscilla marina ATCC 23134 TaxID=313606 RepID=A1ZRJ0_MICM2|nr:hypothetical protein [Microscilla marina]EAY27080.1 hypothetical protein M23134_04768 [Microscilla marina ATCC 23134]
MKKNRQLPKFLTLLWLFALTCFLVPAYAQYDHESEGTAEIEVEIQVQSDAYPSIYKDTRVVDCFRRRKSPRYTSIYRLERELNALQNSTHKLHVLKRQVRKATRVLKSHENALMAEIHDIEGYIKVDESLSQPKVMEYYRSINMLTSRLLINRAKQRKLRHLERRTRRLISHNNDSRSGRYRSCGKSYYSRYKHRHHRHHENTDSNPWMLAFVGLFGVNLLIGGLVAYKTLGK